MEIVTDVDDDENIAHDPRANSEGPVVGSSIGNFNHTPPSTPPQTISAPSSKLDQLAKRGFSDRTSTSPSTSPVRKRERLQINSAIHNALELTAENGKPAYGLLRFFSKGTKDDVQDYWHREEEQRQEKESEMVFHVRELEIEKKNHEKELTRLRQQKRRNKVKNQEILMGKRSPGGTKRKVR